MVCFAYEMNILKCRACGMEKTPNEFYFRKDSGRHGKDCKECQCKIIKAKYHDPVNKQKILLARRKGGRKGMPLIRPDIEPADWVVVLNAQKRRSDASDYFKLPPDLAAYLKPSTVHFFAVMCVLNRELIERAKRRYRISKREDVKTRRYNYNNRPDVAAKRKAQFGLRMATDPVFAEESRRKGRQYFMDNKPSVYAYRKARSKTDPGFRISNNLRTYIYQRVGPKGSNTGQSRFLEIVGCTIDEFRIHLEKYFEPWMSWDNYGKGDGKWSVDHTLPCASFDLTDPEQIKKCFHYSNMKPMAFLANIRKGDTIPLNG